MSFNLKTALQATLEIPAVLYHGTTGEREANIMQSGLQPLSMDTPILPGSKHSPYVKAPSNFGNSELGYVYLARTRQAATSWVRQIAKDYWFGSSMGKNPIQAIVAQVDPRQLDPKLLDKDPYARLPSLRYRGTVPASALTIIGRYTWTRPPGKSLYEQWEDERKEKI